MAVGFVPYVPTKDPVPDDVEGLKRGAAIVGHDRSLRRYRHRPAVLEHRADGELRLLVRRLGLAPTDPNDVWSTAASADLTRSSVRSLSRGVAYLATDVRPAVRAIWKHGPLVLDFDDIETAFTRSWRAGVNSRSPDRVGRVNTSGHHSDSNWQARASLKASTETALLRQHRQPQRVGLGRRRRREARDRRQAQRLERGHARRRCW